MSTLPWWAEESIQTFENPTQGAWSESWNDLWVEDSPEMFSSIRSIHYPPRVHVFFVVDELLEGGDWNELNGIHYSEELADNAAKKRAYTQRVPHRVRMVVSYE